MPANLPLVPSVGEYTFDCALDGTSAVYAFRIRWNVRDAKWFMDIAQLDGTPIASGVALVLGASLGAPWSHVAPFALGNFYAIDTSDEGRDAGFDDLGTRVIVRWYSNADLVQFVVTHDG